jgi:hypothetical protein
MIATNPEQGDNHPWRRKRTTRFLFQTFLTLSFMTLMYIAFGSPAGIPALIVVSHPHEYGRIFMALLNQLTLFWTLLISFFTIVFYGTSFTVTPFEFVLGPIRKFVMPPLGVGAASHAGPVSKAVYADGDARLAEDIQVERIDDDKAEADEEGASWQGAKDERVKDEAVYRVLRRSARSAAQLADKMERRINSHLILGVAMGFVGLGVWYYSFFLGPHTVGTLQNWDRVWEFLPRVTILVFIELLAGFFLRQYRIGVEDFKYFLELRRRAEASQVAYTVFDLIQDNKLKLKFASGLLEERSDSRLKKGETTTILEAMKTEENMTLKLISLLGDHLESITKLLHKGREKA